LVYRYDNRRLYFLHSHELVQFVSELNGERPLGEALDDFLRSRALAESARETFLKAVAQLDTMGLLDRS
jgi:exonuclease VII small subunit